MIAELFLEYAPVRELSFFDDGRLKAATYDASPRGSVCAPVAGEATGYAHASELTEEAIVRAGAAVQAVKAGHSGTMALGPKGTNTKLYTDENPILGAEFSSKVKLSEECDAFARARDPAGQTSVVLADRIMDGGGNPARNLTDDGCANIRPLVRLGVQDTVGIRWHTPGTRQFIFRRRPGWLRRSYGG